MAGTRREIQDADGRAGEDVTSLQVQGEAKLGCQSGRGDASLEEGRCAPEVATRPNQFACQALLQVVCPSPASDSSLKIALAPRQTSPAFRGLSLYQTLCTASFNSNEGDYPSFDYVVCPHKLVCSTHAHATISLITKLLVICLSVKRKWGGIHTAKIMSSSSVSVYASPCSLFSLPWCGVARRQLQLICINRCSLGLSSAVQLPAHGSAHLPKRNYTCTFSILVSWALL